VNPPGNPKAHYQTNNSTPVDAEDWLQAAETQQGSWWPDLLAWLGDRCGKQESAPNELGGGGLRPIIDAPGTYVFDT
jgi:polyhydroxyalkanoate synthase subunit PhaC